MDLFARPLVLLLAPFAAAALVWAEGTARSSGGSLSYVRRTARAVVVVALVCAAAGLRLSTRRVIPPVVLVVDVSASTGDVQDTEDAMLGLLRELPRGMPRAAVAFASQPRVALRFDGDLGSVSLVELSASMSRSASDIAGGIRMALGLLPPEVNGAVVVLSDGRNTLGNAASAAIECRARNVTVFAVPYPKTDFSDIRIEKFSTPARREEGRGVPLDLTLSATYPAEVEVVLRRLPSGTEVGLTRVTLNPGVPERVFYTDRPSKRGVVRYEAVVTPLGGADDAFSSNNSAEATCLIVGRPRVLVVSDESRSAAEMLRQLEQKFVIDECRPIDMPSGADEVAGYAAVVLENVDREAVSAAAENALVQYVESGGGLFMVGGARAYGAGKWRDSDPLAALMPVAMSPGPSDRAFVVLLVDASGSMAMEGTQGRTKMEDARDAVAAIFPELAAEDEVALISFKETARVILDATPVAHLETIVGELDELMADGKTSLAAPLESAVVMLRASDAKRKVVVMLSDGEPTVEVSVAQLKTIASKCAEAGAPVHILGTNPQPKHKELLREIASAGGGTALFESNYSRVSDAFRQAVAQATGRYVRLGPVPVSVETVARQVIGAFEEVPAMGAINRTGVREESLTPVLSFEGDPVLAVSEAGPGRTAAFMSSFGGRWGGMFGQWPRRGELFAQILRWVAVPPSDDGIRFFATSDGREMFVDVEIGGDRALGERNLLNITIDVWSLDSSSEHSSAVTASIVAEQTGLGRYRAQLPSRLAVSGRSVLVRAIVTSPGAGRREIARTPIQLPASKEFMCAGVDHNALDALVRPTGGKIVKNARELSNALLEAEALASREITPELSAIVLAVMLVELLGRFIGTRGRGAARA